MEGRIMGHIYVMSQLAEKRDLMGSRAELADERGGMRVVRRRSPDAAAAMAASVSCDS